MQRLSHFGQTEGHGKPGTTRQAWPHSEHLNVLFFTFSILRCCNSRRPSNGPRISRERQGWRGVCCGREAAAPLQTP